MNMTLWGLWAILELTCFSFVMIFSILQASRVFWRRYFFQVIEIWPKEKRHGYCQVEACLSCCGSSVSFCYRFCYLLNLDQLRKEQYMSWTMSFLFCVAFSEEIGIDLLTTLFQWEPEIREQVIPRPPIISWNRPISYEK